MSGHSRWAGIKHKKAIIDSKRGKAFTKLGKEISVAAKQGGGNVENNARLRKAVEIAREANMPQENVKKAIQRGTGEIPGVIFEELRYEGYGPGGSAVLVDISTDNKNRTAPEIRKIFSDHGGNIAEAGSVGWMFSAKGIVTVEKSKVNEESLMTLALDAGAEDIKSIDDEYLEVITAPVDFEKVKVTLQKGAIPIVDAQLTLVSQTTVALEGKQAEDILKLVEALEDHDDVNKVFSNFDVPKEMMMRS